MKRPNLLCIAAFLVVTSGMAVFIARIEALDLDPLPPINGAYTPRPDIIRLSEPSL